MELKVIEHKNYQTRIVTAENEEKLRKLFGVQENRKVVPAVNKSQLKSKCEKCGSTSGLCIARSAGGLKRTGVVADVSVTLCKDCMRKLTEHNMRSAGIDVNKAKREALKRRIGNV